VQGKKARGCSLAARDLPLERFRLPTDGRKWKSLARGRAEVLSHIAAWSNDDGTFERDGINYSPSEQRLIRRFDRRTFYRRTTDLRVLDLLDWDRPNRHNRRIYKITPDAPYPDDLLSRNPEVSDSSNPDVPDSEDCEVSDSSNPDVPDSNPEVSPCRPEVSDSQSGGVTSATYPMVLSFGLPTTPRPPKSPIKKTDGGLDEKLYSWHKEIIAIRFGRKRRIPSLNLYVNRNAQIVCDHLLRHGFPSARVVTETIVTPDHLIRLDPETREERNLRAAGLSPDAFRS